MCVKLNNDDTLVNIESINYTLITTSNNITHGHVHLQEYLHFTIKLSRLSARSALIIDRNDLICTQQ